MAVPTQIAFAGVPNLALDATLSATTAETDSPVTNLQNGSLYSMLVSTSASVDYKITADMITAVSPQAFALIGTNLSNAATVKLESATNSAFSTGLVNHGTTTPFGSLLSVSVTHTPPWGRHVIIILSSVPAAKRYWRFTINDTSNTDSEYQFGVLLMSQIVYPGIGAIPVEFQVERSPVAHVDLSRRVMSAQYGSLTATERSNFVNLAMEYGRSGRFLVVMRPQQTSAYPDEALYCTLENTRVSHGRGDTPVRAAMVFAEVFD